MNPCDLLGGLATSLIAACMAHGPITFKQIATCDIWASYELRCHMPEPVTSGSLIVSCLGNMERAEWENRWRLAIDGESAKCYMSWQVPGGATDVIMLVKRIITTEPVHMTVAEYSGANLSKMPGFE